MSRFNEIVPASVRNVQALADQPTITPAELKAVFDAGSETIVEEYNNQVQKLNTLEPAGMISAFAGSIAPNGWLMCDGSLVDRSTYQELFTAIGTQYNLETDSDLTKFRLPNLIGKTVVMQDNTQTEFNELGKTGGEKTHTLTINEMPSHNHNQANNNGSYPTWKTTAHDNGLRWDSRNGWHQETLQKVGGNQAHNNLQPYIVLNYIIRT